LGEGNLEGSNGKKVGRRVFEPNLQRAVVKGPHAYEGRVCDFSLVILLRVYDIEDDVGVFGGSFGIQQPLPGINEILGSNRLAIAPTDVVPQVKEELLSSVKDFPKLCHHGGGLQVAVKLRETHHQVDHDVERDVVRRARPVQARRFCAEIDSKGCFLDLFRGRGARP